jgi:hypothetical protein
MLIRGGSNMNMKTKALLVFFFLLFFGTVRTTEACSCADQTLSERAEAESQFAAATVVFEGEVVLGGHSITAPVRGQNGLSMVVFRVIRAYKGLHEELVQVYDGMAGSSCEFGQPEPGKKFFVYGYKRADDRIFVEACTRTSALESAAPDIRYARGESATKDDLVPAGERRRLEDDPTLGISGATIHGSVRRADGKDAVGAFVTVWHVGANGQRENLIAAVQKVNDDGTFEVRYLSAGGYVITAQDSQKTSTSRFVGESMRMNLRESQTYSDVNVVLHAEPVGTVSIRVVAPPSLQDRVFVWLRDAHMDDAEGDSPYKFASTAQLDEKNVATFQCVPYALYDVYVMLTGEDLTKPSWTHDDLRVQVSGPRAEAVVELRERPKE